MFSTLWGIILVAILGGVLIAIQGQLLGGVSKQSLGFLAPALVNYVAGILFIIPMFVFQKVDWGGVSQLPWYSWLIGLCGILIVGCIGLAVQKLGVLGTMSVFFVAQITASAFIDQIGWLGDVHPFTLSKAAGVLAMLGGLWLMFR